MSEPEPFDRVVARHGLRVLRVCRAVLGPTDAAQDAWSEAFLAALRAWPDLDDHRNVEGWLVTIAHRKAIDIVRARHRHAVPVEAVPDGTRSVQGLPTMAGDPGDDADLHADTELWAALASLSDRQRRAVALHHVGGLAHAEVAELLGGTPAAARKASSDGIRRIRTILAHRDPAATTGGHP